MTDERADPRRWITLGISILSAFIVVLDNTVLNVSIPTMLRDLHTTLPSLEWVITGYALTFAALLIIGGRLGDVYGHRRILIDAMSEPMPNSAAPTMKMRRADIR